MYTEAHKAEGAKKLPLNMLDALRAFEADATLGGLLGAEFTAAFTKLRHREWSAYAHHLSDWERETTLDC